MVTVDYTDNFQTTKIRDSQRPLSLLPYHYFYYNRQLIQGG